MKRFRLLLALAATFAMITPAAAQQAARWSGTVKISAVSPQCANYGTEAGDFNYGVVMPQQVQISPWNNQGSFLTYRSDLMGTVFSWKITGNLASGAGPIASVLTRIDESGFSAQHNVQLTNVLVSPAVIDVNTQTVLVTFTVSNWYGTPDCSVTLKGRYVRPPAGAPPRVGSRAFRPAAN